MGAHTSNFSAIFKLFRILTKIPPRIATLLESCLNPAKMPPKVNSIILIDDDAATNFIHEKVIEDADCSHEVCSFQRAENALEYLFKHPDVKRRFVFLDINMPGMDGWEFLGELEKHCDSVEDHCKIVMLTNSLNPDDQIKAKERGCVADFHNKPLTEEDLQGFIRKHFN